MSYKLEKPYTEKAKINFIVEYNHRQRLQIKETNTALYALKPWEKLEGDEVIDNKEEYEQEQAQKERERINLLSMTKREMFLGLYQAKQITPDMLKAQITDPQALIEFEYANDYYRGNPLIDVIGSQLGFTSEQLDKFFETKDYKELQKAIQVELEPEPTEEENSTEQASDASST